MSSNRDIVGLQYLRGLAASMVVAFHLAPRLAERYTLDRFSVSVLAGGVDVFFVISGFIIWISTQRTPEPWSWWRSRLIRIVPMYWLTLVACLFLLPLPTLGEAVKAFLFIPAIDSRTGDSTPFFGPGWTLNYEFFFYLVMAGLLWVPRLRLIGILVIFGSLVALRPLADPTSAIQFRMTSPLLFEFVAGIGIAVVLPRVPYPRVIGLTSVVAAVMFLVLVSPRLYPNGPRAVYFGGPAALLVFGTVCLEDALRRRVIVPLRKLGDASYSLYLSHMLLIPLFAWSLSEVGVTAPILRFLTSIALCVAASILIHGMIEVPLLRSMRSAFLGAKPNKLEESVPASAHAAAPALQAMPLTRLEDREWHEVRCRRTPDSF